MDKKQPMRVKEFAQRIGRSPSTVRRWDREGLLHPSGRVRGQRRYTEEDVSTALQVVLPALPAANATVGYLRTLDPQAIDDLAAQRQIILSFATDRGISIGHWITDAGTSALDTTRSGLMELLRMTAARRVIEAAPDRLEPFAMTAIASLIRARGGEVLAVSETPWAEDEAVDNVQEILLAHNEIPPLDRLHTALTAMRRGELR